MWYFPKLLSSKNLKSRLSNTKDDKRRRGLPVVVKSLLPKAKKGHCSANYFTASKPDVSADEVKRNKREGKRRLVYTTTKEFFPPSLYFYFQAKQTHRVMEITKNVTFEIQMLSLLRFYDIRKELKIPSQFSSKEARTSYMGGKSIPAMLQR